MVIYRLLNLLFFRGQAFMRNKLKSLIFTICFISFCQPTFAAIDAQLKCPPVEKIRDIKFWLTWYEVVNYHGWVFSKTVYTGLTRWFVYFYSDIDARNPADALTQGQAAFSSLRNQMTDPPGPTGPDQICEYYLGNGQPNSVFARLPYSN